MKRIILFIFSLILVCTLLGCIRTNNSREFDGSDSGVQKPPTAESDETAQEASESDEIMDKTLVLKINNTEVDVSWTDNKSVVALKKLAKDELTISMSRYGGFEQVGSLGATLPSNDIKITTTAGDVVLYSSNQIVIFYGSNTWSYTKLGHINLSKNELVGLLANDDATITLSLK